MAVQQRTFTETRANSQASLPMFDVRKSLLSSSLSVLLYVVESLLSLTEISRSYHNGNVHLTSHSSKMVRLVIGSRPSQTIGIKPIAHCCKKALELSSLGIKSLQSHAKSERHKVAVKGLQRVQVLFGSVTNVTRSKYSAGYRFSRIQCHTQWFRINLHTEKPPHSNTWVLNTVTVVQGERRHCRTFPSNVPRLRHSQDLYMQER